MGVAFKIIIAGFALSILGVGVYYIREAGRLHEELKTTKEALTKLADDVERSYKIGADLEKRLRETNNLINHKLKDEFDEVSSKDPVYANCVMPATGVLPINSALARGSSR